MFATLFSIALFALPAFGSDFSIDTPKEIQSCAPVTFKWHGGKGPYDLVIVASKAPCGDILADLGDGHQGTTLTWQKAILPENMFGQDVSLSLEDANGDEAWSASIPFVKGDTSCMTNTSPETPPAPANVAATPSSSSSSGGGVVAGAAASDPYIGSALTSHKTSGSLIVGALAALLVLSL